MERKQPAYWMEFRLIWWNEIKSWFGWGNWRQAMTSLIITLGGPLLLFFGGKIDVVIEDVWLKIAALLTGVFWLLIIAIGSYLQANRVLYEKQKEIQNNQWKIINSQIPGQLDIFVGPSPKIRGIYENEKYIQMAYLTVISREKKKIIEFHAKKRELLQRTADMEPDLRGAMFGLGVSNVRFLWENGDVFTNLIPGDRDELLITEFDPEEGYPVFGQPKLSAHDRKKPSIYEVSIQFKGKREGETDFAYHNYRIEIYCHPEYQILDFAEQASDIPDDLKSKVFFANKDQEE